MVGAQELIARWRCRQLHAALVDHAQGRSAAAQQPTIAAHLRDCARCRAAHAALQEVPALLVQVAVPPRDESFWLRQRQQIMRAVRQSPAPGRAAAPVVGWWRPAAVMTALLIALAAVQLLSRSAPPSSDVAAGLAVVENGDELALLEAAELLAPPAEIAPEVWSDDESPLPDWAVSGAGQAVPRMSDLSDEELDSLNGLIGSESMPS
jgi:anti-sigma factor RsiW